MSKKKVIYLGAKEHRFTRSDFDFTYNDIIAYPGIDLLCDMLDVDLSKYDVIIATPPCNYYSHANWRFETSCIAQMTKHLLPDIIDSCILIGKPFLIENAVSKRLPQKPCYSFKYGHHIFYTNVFLFDSMLPKYEPQGLQYKPSGKRDNNPNVHCVMEMFLDMVV